MLKQGYYFQLGRKEVFVETSYKRITDAFLEKVLLKLLLPVNPDTKKELRYYIIPATCEIKHCTLCPDLGVEPFDYYNICGKNFSGYGSRVDDGRTIIVKID